MNNPCNMLGQVIECVEWLVISHSECYFGLKCKSCIIINPDVIILAIPVFIHSKGLNINITKKIQICIVLHSFVHSLIKCFKNKYNEY